MSCFADLGSCQSCKSQEQCKKKGDNLLLSDQYSTIFHPSYIMLDSSPIVPFQVPLVAGDRWGHLSHWPWNHLSRPTRSVSRLPEEPPHPGDGKMLEKIKKVRITWQFSFKKQVVAGPKLIILYIISNTIQEYGLFQFRSEALGNPTKIRVKLNTLVH